MSRNPAATQSRKTVPWALRADTRSTLRLDRMVRRDQVSTTEASVFLSARAANRQINAQDLTPQRVTTLGLGLRPIRLGEAARHSFDATLSFGLLGLNATKDPADAARDVPRAQFTRLEFGWQRQGALGTAGTLVTDLRAQASGDTLYGSEQMGIGSFSTVRGYDSDGAAGETGLYLRNDLYLAPEAWTRALPEGLETEAIQPHLFVDYGLVTDRATRSTRALAGAGLGLSWSLGRVTASGIIGLPLVDAEGRLRPGDPVVQIRADLKTW